jgi:hypothetical protein
MLWVMSAIHDLEHLHRQSHGDRRQHPLRTIRDIRAWLPEDQRAHFDAELAETDIDELPEMLHRVITLAKDGFDEFVRSAPFDGLDFGARSYDDEGTE